MGIASREQLINLLGKIASLTEFDRNFMVDTASFLPDGRLGTLYMKTMVSNCSNGEIRQFLLRAGAYMEPYGGDTTGEIVYYHYRATGNPPPFPPCKPMQWRSCWVSKDNPWKPTI